MSETPPLPQAIELLRERLGDRPARVALVTGSGLGALAQIGHEVAGVPFSEIPGLGGASVVGHAGRMALLELAGEDGAAGPRLICIQGRRHLYEGIEPALSGYTMRLMAALGIEIVILTNAAGGLARRFVPGDLMLISDVINLMFRNPLRGPHNPADGPRFPDMSEVCDRELGERLRAAARRQQVEITPGVYLALSGPTYETRAEVKAWQVLGADAVGMSTVPEILVAKQAGMRVLAISLITNSHVHPAAPPTHDEVLEMGQLAGAKISKIVRDLLLGLDRPAAEVGAAAVRPL